jgi:hypothetical protein
MRDLLETILPIHNTQGLMRQPQVVHEVCNARLRILQLLCWRRRACG